eukprot:gene11347-3391_t
MCSFLLDFLYEVVAFLVFSLSPSYCGLLVLTKRNHTQNHIQTLIPERSCTASSTQDGKPPSGPIPNPPQIRPRYDEARQPSLGPLDLIFFSACGNTIGQGPSNQHRPPAPNSIFKPVGQQMATTNFWSKWISCIRRSFLPNMLASCGTLTKIIDCRSPYEA